jgi:hypothetical protein
MAIMLTAVFTACNTSDPEDEDEDEEEEEVEIIHKVGFIYNGFLEGSTHNLIWESARLQLERNLDIETCYIENVFVTNFSEAVGMLLSRDVTIIVSTNEAFKNMADRAALANKDVVFISFGGDNTASNVTNFKPLVYQPANVAGLAASYNSDAASFGIVADHTMFNAAGVVNSYIIGLKDFLSRSVDVHVNYASSTNEADIAAAIDDLQAKGAEVVMLYMSSDFGIRYCEQIGMKVVAYAGNLPELAPNYYVTGFYFNVNSYLTEQVMFIINEMFSPRTTFGEMRSGHALLTRLNSNQDIVAPDTRALTDLLFEEIEFRDGIFKGQILDNHGKQQVEPGYTLNYSEVLSVNWLEFSVGSNVTNFSEPREEIPLTQLAVRGEWPNGVRPNLPPSITLPPQDATGEPATATATPAPANQIESIEAAIARVAQVTGFPANLFSDLYHLPPFEEELNEGVTVNGQRLTGWIVDTREPRGVFYEPVDIFFVTVSGDVYINWECDFVDPTDIDSMILREYSSGMLTAYDTALFDMPDFNNSDIVEYLDDSGLIPEGAVTGVAAGDTPELLTIFYDGEIIEGYHIQFARSVGGVPIMTRYLLDYYGTVYVMEIRSDEETLPVWGLVVQIR